MCVIALLFFGVCHFDIVHGWPIDFSFLVQQFRPVAQLNELYLNNASMNDCSKQHHQDNMEKKYKKLL